MRAVLLLVCIASIARADVAPRSNVVRVEHRPADDNPTLGPSVAPVTAELFFVPGQIESNRAYRRVVELWERHPRRLRVVFRVITRGAAVVVPIVALEAFAQGKFADLMDAILATRSGTVRHDDLPALARAAGLDPDRVAAARERALEPEQYPAVLRGNENRRARRRGNNIPELLFNGDRVDESLTGLDVEDLEKYYDAAYDEAQIFLADGVPMEHLVEAAERAATPTTAIEEYKAGPIDDPEPDYEAEPAAPLLDRALDLRGLPTEGPEDAAVEVVLLCNLRYVSCRTQLEEARKLLQHYPDELRLSWVPWFDVAVVGNETAPRIHAAALCAERQGQGWKWIDETLRQVFRGAGEGNARPDELIDTVAELAEVDRDALDDCLDDVDDQAVIDRVQAAIAAGVRHSPAMVIGGRVYEGGFTSWQTAQDVLDKELAPGLLERMAPSWE